MHQLNFSKIQIYTFVIEKWQKCNKVSFSLKHNKHVIEVVSSSYPLSHFVYFNVQEVQVLIEVLVFEQAFTDHLKGETTRLHQRTASLLTSIKGCDAMCYLVGHLALEVHGQFEHVIVRRTGKQDFAGVQLV